jgi:beta-glucosidase
MTEKPLYPFGFGLSYTGFSFDSLKLSAAAISAGEKIKATVSMSNTGKRDGEDVIQLYIAKKDRSADDPFCSLRAFRRINVPAGKTVNADFELPASAFESVNADGRNVLVPGAYTIYACDAAPAPVSAERGAPKPAEAVVTVK